jgi:hypothetical protein
LVRRILHIGWSKQDQDRGFFRCVSRPNPRSSQDLDQITWTGERFCKFRRQVFRLQIRRMKNSLVQLFLKL